MGHELRFGERLHLPLGGYGISQHPLNRTFNVSFHSVRVSFVCFGGHSYSVGCAYTQISVSAFVGIHALVWMGAGLVMKGTKLMRG